MSQLIDIKVPDIGDFSEVPVIDVFVKPGDVIKVDDALITLESDKATMDVPASAAGVVKEVLVKLGDKIGEGTVVVRVEASDAAAAAAAPAPAAATSSPAPAPAPDSYASMPESDVAIWLITIDPSAHIKLPPAKNGSRRKLFFYKGDSLTIDGKLISSGNSFEVKADQPLVMENGASQSRLLLLQGRPIDEPVVQYGPFVMNTEAEIRAAFEDYRKTRFGGWPWERPDHVHPRDEGRFAKYRDGRIERP